MSDPVRVTIVTEIPSPYRIPLFNALAAQQGIDLDVVFLRAQQAERPHEVREDELRFRWTVLRGAVVVGGYRWLVMSLGAGRAVRRRHPDVVVLGGWNQPAFWFARWAAWREGARAVVWVESTARDARSASRVLALAKRGFVRSCSACLVPGTAAAAYVRTLGVPEERIAVAPNAVDLGIFGSRVRSARDDRAGLRARLGVGGVTFLYVGRLSPEKGVDVLLSALAGLRDVRLVVAGSGPDETALRSLADTLLPGRVRFLGFVQRDALVEWYAAADALVVPSRSEVWGMTLNEGAAAGLPLVATEAAGAAWDLIAEGVNGFRVASEQPEALAAALSALASDPRLRELAGSRSAAIAEAWTPDAWAVAVAALARKLGRAR